MESHFMNAFWTLRKEIGEPESRQDYWDDAVPKIEALAQKYDDFFCRNMALLILFDLELRSGMREHSDARDSLYMYNRWRELKGLPKVEVIT